MLTYQAAYAKTVTNITDRVVDLRKTLLTLPRQQRPGTRHWSWILAPTWSATSSKQNQDGELYVDLQIHLDYLVDLLLFIERDQLSGLSGEMTSYFEKHDLYWWQSALSLVGNPPYLAPEIIAHDYYVLANQAQKRHALPIPGEI